MKAGKGIDIKYEYKKISLSKNSGPLYHQRGHELCGTCRCRPNDYAHHADTF